MLHADPTRCPAVPYDDPPDASSWALADCRTWPAIEPPEDPTWSASRFDWPRSTTARRTNLAGVARSRRRLRQHAAGKVAEIEIAAGKGEVASRAVVMCRTPCRRRRHPLSPDGHRLSKLAPDPMLEEGRFELAVPPQWRAQPARRFSRYLRRRHRRRTCDGS
jgi:hypothetical protein